MCIFKIFTFCFPRPFPGPGSSPWPPPPGMSSFRAHSNAAHARIHASGGSFGPDVAIEFPAGFSGWCEYKKSNRMEHQEPSPQHFIRLHVIARPLSGALRVNETLSHLLSPRSVRHQVWLPHLNTHNSPSFTHSTRLSLIPGFSRVSLSGLRKNSICSIRLMFLKGRGTMSSFVYRHLSLEEKTVYV